MQFWLCGCYRWKNEMVKEDLIKRMDSIEEIVDSLLDSCTKMMKIQKSHSIMILRIIENVGKITTKMNDENKEITNTLAELSELLGKVQINKVKVNKPKKSDTRYINWPELTIWFIITKKREIKQKSVNLETKKKYGLDKSWIKPQFILMEMIKWEKENLKSEIK